ncbi:hypothetical protein T4C_8727 [Trichinella pseudospiralis]|uniref:Uncharacterized protein n=1 Tax=Trichinella pseudospiralis TaxID=6337 RepID=A0A0V1IIR4_TRIPS|nr:hypothetical protein T4C_8727 [Trichinella pseudospiralis]
MPCPVEVGVPLWIEKWLNILSISNERLPGM